MFVLTEITTFCSPSLRLITTVNFKLLVDHGFINHWLLLLPRQPFGLVNAGYFVCLVNLRIAINNHGLRRSPVVNCGSVTVGDFPPIPGSTSTTEDIYGGDTDIEDSYNIETESDTESASDHSGYNSYMESEIDYGNI